MPQLADVVVTGGVPGRYTYLVPEGLAEGTLPGRRVVVPFGTRTVFGLIDAVREGPAPEGARPVASLLDDGPIVSPEMMSLCRWAADYYAAPLSFAYRSALPPETKGEVTLVASMSIEGRRRLSTGDLPEELRKALRAIDGGQGHLVPDKLLGRLERDGLVHLTRTIETAEAAKFEEVLGIAPGGDPSLLGRSALQRSLYEKLSLLGECSIESLRSEFATVRDLARKLAEKGLIRIDRRPVGAGRRPEGLRWPAPTEEQTQVIRALSEILDQGAQTTCLLEGVTGSGKTEVYLTLIRKVRETGGEALVVVPEIALTPQLSARFQERFGPEVAVLHSGLTDRQRELEWHRIRRGEAPIVIGARSAVFAPLARPRIIVVDEEHDPSFKQESGLRYHGRDLAVVRGKQAGALVLLGSATPSLESLHNAAKGRYQHLKLEKRVIDRPLPEVQLIDLRGRSKPAPENGVTASGLLSPELVTALHETFTRGEQAIVFLNRRGHSTALLCKDCGEVHRCAHCAVAFTWHEHRRALICHHCGQRDLLAEVCAGCGSTRLLLTGAGTEKLEDEFERTLPGVRIARLDRDTAATTKQLGRILARFSAGEIDLLVGTQMVTKGHDFPGVTLVGVLLADGGLHQPDFRAAERTAQLLTQVAGRAGRGEKPGRVLVQTFTPEAPAIAAVQGHDYARFAQAELAERESVGYPPYRRLCLLRIEGEDETQVEAHAGAVARHLDTLRNVELLGPAPAPIPKLRGRFRHQLLVRSADHAGISLAIRHLAQLRTRPPAGISLSIDVDPVDMG